MSDISAIARQFDAIGARFIEALPSRRLLVNGYGIDVNFDRRRKQESFVLVRQRLIDLEIVHAAPARRHLLLMVKLLTAKRTVEKHLYLCGHDERHWFVAAVPPIERGVKTVAEAMEALKPDVVRGAQAREHLRGKEKSRRSNSAFVRQGEWFFLPAPGLVVDPLCVHRNEPLSRGGKPHIAEMAFRRGGQVVHVCRRFPLGLDAEEYRQLLVKDPSAKSWSWRVMTANPEVFVCGRVRHPDHATIELRGWHRVMPNTEARAPWRKDMVFLD